MIGNQMLRTVIRILPAVAVSAAAMLPAAASAQTLEKVKARGNVNCGVNPALPGFAARDAQGKWSGFDIDLCRALAAAIFNDPSKVEFTPLSTTDRLPALQADKIDVLSRNTTWTFSREAPLKLTFAAVTYYDGQGFLVRRNSKATSALELDGASICVQKGTTSELNIADYFRANNLKYQLVALAMPTNCSKPTTAESAPSSPATRRSFLRQDWCCSLLTTTSSCPTLSPRSRSGRSCAPATTSGWAS
jgi:general L-amino acid transport system substrate-binding protein